MRQLSIAILVFSCASDGGPPEARRCEQLRDHLVNLQVRDIHIATGVNREAHRRVMTDALGDTFISSCTSKLTDSEVSCALETTDSASANTCVRSQ
jgi:hypothetical protein